MSASSAPAAAPAPTLPVPLQPWRQWLDGFDAEIVAVLGDWLLRLDPLLGKGSARVQAASPEPDGIGELSARGHYDRLLLSEWSLAELAPDEFLRRAANGEHLFLAPTPVQPRTEPRIVMVFDAGPAQWGDPRLVHVALWILLWRRAQKEQAHLQWGLAHLPGELHDAASKDHLLTLLRARTHAVAAAPQWQAWQDALQQASRPVGERWRIGGSEGASDSDGFTHTARIHAGWDAQLQVRLGARGATRTLALPRLPAAPAARLLGGEFLRAPAQTTATTAKGRFSMRQPPIFSLNGRSVAAQLAGRNVAYQLRLPEPGQRKPSPGRYHEWAAQSQLVCAVTLDKDFGGITCDATHLYFWKLLGQPAQSRPAPEQLTLRPGVPQWLPAALLHVSGKRHMLALIDHARQLVAWPNGAPGKPGAGGGLKRIADDVLALHQTNNRSLIYARAEGIYVGIHQLDYHADSHPRARLLVNERPAAMWFGGAGREAGFHTCCVEHRDRNGGCVLTFIDDSCGQTETVTLAADWKRIGLVNPTGKAKVWQMLVLRSDRRTLIAVGAPGQRVIHSASDDIMSASVSACGRRIALLTLSGELRVLALGADDEDTTTLARIRGTGDEHDA